MQNNIPTANKYMPGQAKQQIKAVTYFKTS